jgi:hypothetical protein
MAALAETGAVNLIFRHEFIVPSHEFAAPEDASCHEKLYPAVGV